MLGQKGSAIGASGAGAPDGTAANPGIFFEADQDTGIYRPADDQIGIVTGGAERVRIHDDFAVQIHAGTPASLPTNPPKLWVNVDGGSLPTLEVETAAVFSETSAAGDGVFVYLISGASGTGVISFGDTSDDAFCQIKSESANENLIFTTGNKATNLTLSGASSSELGQFAGKLGIGTAHTEGTLHVHTATAGGVTASTSYNDLVVENSASTGASFLAANNQNAGIVFGSPSDDVGALIIHNHDANHFRVGTANVGHSLKLEGDNQVLNLTLSGASGSELALFKGNVQIGETTNGATRNLYFDNADANVSKILWRSASDGAGAQITWQDTAALMLIGTAQVGHSVTLAADNNVTNLTLNGASGSETATFAGTVTAPAAAFGLVTISASANTIGSTGALNFAINALAGQSVVIEGALDIDGGILGYTGAATFTGDLRVASDNESHMFVVDAGRDEVNITNRAVLVTDGRGLLNINADTSGTLFHLFTNQADADGANVVFEKAGGTPAGNDVISKQSVRSNTADLTNVEYGYSEWRIGATTNAAQEGYWRTFIYDAGTAYNALHVSADGIVLNEDGRTRFDFRVETLNRTNMIFVDASVDTVTFNGPVFVKNSATTAYQWIDADATYDAQFILGSGGSTHARIGVAGATNGVALTGSLVNELVIQNRDGANWIHLAPTNTFTLSLDGSRNMYLNGVSTHPVAATDAVGVFHIYNGTAPSASATNGVLLYAEDVTASSELKVRDEAGNVTVLSPHNFTLIPDGPSEDMAWAHHSERDGKTINVDMLAAIREVERLSGRKLVWTE